MGEKIIKLVGRAHKISDLGLRPPTCTMYTAEFIQKR